MDTGAETLTVGQLVQFVNQVLEASDEVKQSLEASAPPEYWRFAEYIRAFSGLTAELRYPVDEKVAESLKLAFRHGMAAAFSLGFVAALLDQSPDLRGNPTLLQNTLAVVAVNAKEGLDVQVVTAPAGTDVPAGGNGPMPVVS